MYENFSERSRTVMQFAEEEARRLKCPRVRSEHILLGLAKDDKGLAAYALRILGADYEKLRRVVERMALAGAAAVADGAIPLADDAEKLIQYAWEEARSLRHNRLGTEDLLLGLLQEDRGLAIRAIVSLHVNPDDVRQEVLKLLGHGL